jgi:hypothetical protein
MAASCELPDLLAQSNGYAILRDEFEQRTGRCSGVPQSLDVKKQRECSILFRFVLDYERLPARRVMLGEHPDFRFSLGRRRIGMELVEAFKPNPIGEVSRGSIWKEQERLQDEIVDRAKEIHATNGGRPLRVRVSFADTRFSKRDVAPAAAALAALVPKTSKTRDQSNGGRNGWPNWLADLRVAPRPKLVRHRAHWNAHHAGCVPCATASLRLAIRAKEEKLADYRKSHCDEYWLLVYVDGTSAASFMELTDKRTIFASKFDKVFVFSPMADDPEERVIRLNAH